MGMHAMQMENCDCVGPATTAIASSAVSADTRDRASGTPNALRQSSHSFPLVQHFQRMHRLEAAKLRVGTGRRTRSLVARGKHAKEP